MNVLSDQLLVMRMSLGDGTFRVAVVGDLDACSAATFRELAAAHPDDVRSVELDLARVTFLDAAGVREIIRLRRTALRNGYELMIIAASDVVCEVLTVLKCDELLDYRSDSYAEPCPSSVRRPADS